MVTLVGKMPTTCVAVGCHNCTDIVNNVGYDFIGFGQTRPLLPVDSICIKKKS